MTHLAGLKKEESGQLPRTHRPHMIHRKVLNQNPHWRLKKTELLKYKANAFARNLHSVGVKPSVTQAEAC